ncbi:MAG: isopentenyl-diphosphate Delta-isomerase [Bacteroidetes bacterium]|nr:isopentenyl-diphosphate Delta-isomerase [Bacteroidota bacterium]MBU1578506.1 isopentenyl-diphosphate Delta-isomerase [Bacteroidota bacterium]MBU2465397.1 isopentenyl-diphosphate Delta-isomerase [Bacteroidota bacterium]MBU2559036.1 isopentenyl-diphosphate Delta-isomerase [Bacteroidota bacterium]
MQEQVILVDVDDNPQGLMEKMEAHQKGVLHRAFSIFVFNSKQELMLQQRAFSKYHTPGLWTNTCCSHPRHGESLEAATKRRLKEEMGMQCDIKKAFSFLYKADVGQGLTEHEFDHVFIGHTDELPDINPEEVAGWKYASMDELSIDIAKNPENYTVWFRIAFDEVNDYLKTLKT